MRWGRLQVRLKAARHGRWGRQLAGHTIAALSPIWERNCQAGTFPSRFSTSHGRPGPRRSHSPARLGACGPAAAPVSSGGAPAPRPCRRSQQQPRRGPHPRRRRQPPLRARRGGGGRAVGGLCGHAGGGGGPGGPHLPHLHRARAAGPGRAAAPPHPRQDGAHRDQRDDRAALPRAVRTALPPPPPPPPPRRAHYHDLSALHHVQSLRLGILPPHRRRCHAAAAEPTRRPAAPPCCAPAGAWRR